MCITLLRLGFYPTGARAHKTSIFLLFAREILVWTPYPQTHTTRVWSPILGPKEEMTRAFALFAVLALAPISGFAFFPAGIARPCAVVPSCLKSSVDEQQNEPEKSRSTPNDRRNFVVASSFVTISASFFSPSLAFAAVADDIKSGPVTVIGCNGRTGTECVSLLLRKSAAVRATSRGGAYIVSDDAEDELKALVVKSKADGILNEAVCDVTSSRDVASAVGGARAVIFAASASKEGGTPAAVDNAGLVQVAKACLEAKVPHLIVVSSGAVTKPRSPVYLFLNLFGNIMSEKIQGEDAVRKLYAGNSASGGTETYTIVRPGGLTLESPLGAAALELNQGDTKSGRISRADVASLCVEAISYPQFTGGTTFECYNADTGAPLASVGLSNIMKAKTDGKEEQFISGKERRGKNFQELFRGLEKD